MAYTLYSCLDWGCREGVLHMARKGLGVTNGLPAFIYTKERLEALSQASLGKGKQYTLSLLDPPNQDPASLTESILNTSVLLASLLQVH